MEKSAALIGGGVLGQATAKSLDIEYIYDEIKSRSNIEKSKLKDFEYIFICVPTPSNENGCDISIVEKSISENINGQTFIIRSTVIPGTAESLMKKYGCEIISNPEFLTEKTSIEDAMNPDIIVIGGRNSTITNSFSQLFYTKDFSDSQIIKADNKTAETIKYSINNFYAVKVIFANYLYRFCKKENVDYDMVVDAMYKRKWIGENHLAVPFNGKLGVNGKCLPKDLIAFAEYTGDDFFLNMVKSMKDIKEWKL